MSRVFLVVYLSLATVLGPALCCCNAQQLFALVDGSKCCGLHARQSAAETADHDHHGNSHHHHEHLPAKDAAQSEQTPAHDEHDGQKCPCGQHHASMVATVTDSAKVKAVELQNQTLSVLVAILPILPDFDVLEATSFNAHRRPADLYGRELLRAYQIMRC